MAQTDDKNQKNRRSVKNILVDSRFQLTYVLYFISFGLISATLVVAIISHFQKKFFELVINSDKDISPNLFLGFGSIMQEMATALAIFVVLYSILGVVLATFLSHKIVGPAAAIRKFIEDLKAGRFGGQMNLRQGDEWRDLEKDLNELSLILKEKIGK
ncbi:MAG: hypothetical protein A4S09_13340 [Proteobacteria bacterium SG_bin7]|nr:MAG: hypothetical protein A4S09_13340 [Proteobacteria bacterium SG_bin7]